MNKSANIIEGQGRQHKKELNDYLQLKIYNEVSSHRIFS
jgi:hypothetical protein